MKRVEKVPESYETRHCCGAVVLLVFCVGYGIHMRMSLPRRVSSNTGIKKYDCDSQRCDLKTMIF